MIVSYLTFDGKTEEAFNFYKSVLGGEITNIQHFGDTPHGAQMSEEDKKKVMHVALKTPFGTLMGSDHLDYMGEKFQMGNNFSMSIHPNSEGEATRLFSGLSAGGNVVVPLEKAFWGAYFGMFVDKFGLKWMVNYEYPK